MPAHRRARSHELTEGEAPASPSGSALEPVGLRFEARQQNTARLNRLSVNVLFVFSAVLTNACCAFVTSTSATAVLFTAAGVA